MKLTRVPKCNKFKSVQYFNLNLVVPEETKYITVDQDGVIIVWFGIEKPYIQQFDFQVLDWCGEMIEYDVGEVDLEGMDWKDTLVEY